MKDVSSPDERWMREALHEGAKGLGLTSPNPAVGAVVVRAGECLGVGHHRKAGQPHAEVNAIADACRKGGEGATHGATLYVTLEPCSTHGRTPPCVDAILAAGIARVVVGTVDPNPSHAGRGLDILVDAGVEVTSGSCEQEARDLIRFFTKHQATGLPWVIAKTAATLDGRTTLPPDRGRWISCEASREDVQAWRRQCDAILVGGETFRRDNPALTLRGEWARDRLQPLRVVFTTGEELPESHQLFTDEFADRTRVHRGLSLRESLRRLGEEGALAVMIESGGRLLAHALGEGLVDEVVLYLAPILGGGATRILPVDDLVADLTDVSITPIDRDIRVVGRILRGGEITPPPGSLSASRS